MGFAFVFLSGNCLIAGQAMPSCEVADDLQVAAARGVEERCLTISVLRREVHAARHADLREFETPLSHAVCAEKKLRLLQGIVQGGHVGLQNSGPGGCEVRIPHREEGSLQLFRPARRHVRKRIEGRKPREVRLGVSGT